MKKRTLFYTFGILILVLAFFPMVYTFCNQLMAEDDILSATIYNTSQYNLGGEGLALTSAGVNITDWKYNTSKYLQINTNVPDDGKTYKVCVKLPKELYFVTKEFLTPAGFSNVTFNKNSSLTVNGNQTYGNATSGEACYTLMNGVTTSTLQLEISYDYVLWDKMANSLITEPTDKAIDVKLYTVEAENSNLVKNIFVKEAYAGESYGFYAYNYLLFDGSSSNTAKLLLDDNTPTHIQVGARANSQEAFKMYYDEIIYELVLPRYTDPNGVAHYLNYDWDNIAFNNTIGKTPDYEIDKSQMAEGIVKITFHNYYSSNSTQFKVKYVFPNTIDKTLATNFVFKAPKASSVYIKNKKDELVNLWTTDLLTMTYTSEREEKVYFPSPNAGVSISYTNKTNESINELGYFTIANSGTGDSGRKHVLVEFDYDNTNYIKVTTMRIPIDTIQQYVDLTYSLVDDAGNLVSFDKNGNIVPSGTPESSNYKKIKVTNTAYNNTNPSSQSIIVSRSLLPENERNYYFKTMAYDIKTIKAGISLYSPSGPKSTIAAGTFFGYVGDVSQNVNVYSRMTVSGDGFANISTNARSILTNSSNSSFNVDTVKVNNSINNASITAGNSISLSGILRYIDYPYGNTLWFNNVVLGLLLPNGISVNEDSLKFTLSNNKVNVDHVEIEDLYNGTKMWKIYLDKNIVLGGYNEDLRALSSAIVFSLQLNTEYYMSQQTVLLNSALFVASAQTETIAAQTNAASGAKGWALKKDTYDLNDNGSVNDYIGGMNPTETTAFEIVPQSATFDITDAVSVNNGDNSNMVNLFNQNDSVNYKLSLNCTNGGQASDFSYYIPIPKTTSGIDSYMITSKTGLFGLSLQGEATINGHDLYNLYYTTSTGLNMNNLDNADITWLPASQITNFNDVTMIKIVAKESTIPNGSNTTISLNLKYNGNTFNEEAGSKFTYHSAGNYTYIVNGRETTGTFATPGITLRLNYGKTFSPLTLTAAPNRNPIISGNVNSMQTIESELPIFINQQNLKITNVETNNVVLQTKAYINNNLDMAGIYANETFGITMSLNNGSEVNVMASANTSPINVGSTGNNKATVLKYTIYNADNLTDNTTNRYIIVTLTSDNGVTIKQKININRELAIANNPVSAIVAGNRYQLFNDTTTNVTISRNASFTAQFVLNYIPDLYDEKSLIFDLPLPVGTVLTLYDYAESNAPTYWYYKVTEATNIIPISKFKKMGYTNTNYTHLIGEDPIEQIYMVLVDFKYVDNNPTSNYKVYLELESSTIDNVLSQELAVKLENNRTFSLASSSNSVNFGENFTLSYSMAGSLGIESNYFGRKMAYVIKTNDNVPIDTYILVNDEKYYLNKDNQFIIPLGDVIGENKNITLSFNSDMNSNLANFNFNVDLMISTTANGDAPLAGEVVASKTVTLNNSNKISMPSFKITDISKRIISKTDLKEEQTITFDYLKVANMKVYVELQQKIGSGYQRVTTQLNSVNGVTTHKMGVFEINAINGSNNMNFKLANVTECGTYRLLFTIKDSNGKVIYEIPYAIIVRDNYS